MQWVEEAADVRGATDQLLEYQPLRLGYFGIPGLLPAHLPHLLRQLAAWSKHEPQVTWPKPSFLKHPHATVAYGSLEMYLDSTFAFLVWFLLRHEVGEQILRIWGCRLCSWSLRWVESLLAPTFVPF